MITRGTNGIMSREGQVSKESSDLKRLETTAWGPGSSVKMGPGTEPRHTEELGNVFKTIAVETV